MVTELILETCIALRDGREQNACTAFSGIIAEAADNEADADDEAAALLRLASNISLHF